MDTLITVSIGIAAFTVFLTRTLLLLGQHKKEGRPRHTLHPNSLHGGIVSLPSAPSLSCLRSFVLCPSHTVHVPGTPTTHPTQTAAPPHSSRLPHAKPVKQPRCITHRVTCHNKMHDL